MHRRHSLFAPLMLSFVSACAAGKDDAPADTDVGSTGSADASSTSDAGSEADESGGDDSDGDDGPADGSDSGGPQGTGAAETLIAALCEWDFQCCGRGELDYRLGPFTADAADCTARFVEQLQSNDNVNESPRGDLLYLLGFAVDLSRSQLDEEAAQACADAIAARQCNAAGEVGACVPGGGDDPCRLDRMFTGLQDVGDPCSAALAGFGIDIECAPGSNCENVDEDWICVDKGLVDEFCEGDDKCEGGLYCDLGTGRCAARHDVGESCSFEDELAPDLGTEVVPCLEHLSCDPHSNTCAAYCTTGFTCAADESCADGDSCIPEDIGEGVYSYCAARGLDNGDRCDTHRDCGDALYCNGSSCEHDLLVGDACGADFQCPSGAYCSGTCQIVINAGAACVADVQCNPDTTVGCVTSGDGTLCRTALLADNAPCVPAERAGGNWCVSGICEDLSDDATANPRCQPGALSGIACDENDATHGVPRCATTHYCDEGTCHPKADAGGDCEDDGALQCMNGACQTIWSGEHCTDAPPLGSEHITCDGA